MSRSDDPTPPWERVREFNDRWPQWLLEDSAHLRDLVHLAAPRTADRLDFGHARRLSRSFIGPELARRETDILWEVPWLPAADPMPEPVWVYLLVEHQSEPDPELGLQMLVGMVHLWRSQRRTWRRQKLPAEQRRLRVVIPLVFYTGSGRWRGPRGLLDLMEVPPQAEAFVPHWENLFLSLHGIGPEALTALASVVGWVLRLLQAEKQPLEELADTISQAFRGIEGFPTEALADWESTAWFMLLLAYHRRSDEEYTVLERLILDGARASKFADKGRVEAMSISMAERHRREAELLGEQRELRGERRGKQALLLDMLSAKFAAIPPSVPARVEAATSEQLRVWSLRLLTAERLDQVFADD